MDTTGTNSVRIGLPFVALAVVLVLTAVLIGLWSRIGRRSDVLTAAGRAVVQLAAVSAVIGVVLRFWWSTIAFLLLMSLVAAGTSARRVTGSLAPRSWWTWASILVGVVPVLALILVSTVLPLHPVAVLPSAGILIGGAMTATSIAGRRLQEELRDRRGEYEALLSLGFLPVDAIRLVGRPVAELALVPGLDQTRTVGLVTLPGAFVGVLLAGASPWQAGATQLLILLGLLVVQAAAVGMTVELIARGRLATAELPR